MSRERISTDNIPQAKGKLKVLHEDGDTEEYDVEQIGVMLHKPNYTNIAQALSATRHE